MTSEKSWDNVKKGLKETFNLSDYRIFWLSEVRKELRNLASGGISTAPDFTLHNETHSDNIVLLLSKLVKFFQTELSEYEVYLLVAAAYLHDIGMFFSAARFEEEVLPNMEHALEFCPDKKCDSDYQDSADFNSIPVCVQIRSVHHLLSAYLISEEGQNVFHLPFGDKPHVIAICRGHRKANIKDAGCICYETTQTNSGEVRRQLLAALIRLTDALDFYPDRAPEEVFRTRAWDFLLDPIALKHWFNHYFATSVYPTINDKGGNRFLDCQMSYTVPTRRKLNGRTYKDFFEPSFIEFFENVQKTDFNVSQYPPIFQNFLNIQDIQIHYEIREEPGAVELPDKIIEVIEQSGCENAISFIDYLKDKDIGSDPHQVSLVIDRRPELETFRCLLDGDDIQHSLLILVGEPGQGKTCLMETYEGMCSEGQVDCVSVDLFDVETPIEILDGIWQRLGAIHFSRYARMRERVGELGGETIQRKWQKISEAFFDDWREIEEIRRIVILLDTYERAPHMIQSWIERTFLDNISDIEQVIIVIGGRTWPKISDHWITHGYSFPLEGVQIKDYREYAERRMVKITESDLVGLHKAMNGLPKLFVDYVDSLELGEV